MAEGVMNRRKPWSRDKVPVTGVIRMTGYIRWLHVPDDECPQLTYQR